MAKKSAEEGATKPAKASKPAKKTAEETAKPAKPKYADMIAELIQDCENARVGVSRIGLLKVTSGSFMMAVRVLIPCSFLHLKCLDSYVQGLHDKFGLGGADAEERERKSRNSTSLKDLSSR